MIWVVRICLYLAVSSFALDAAAWILLRRERINRWDRHVLEAWSNTAAGAAGVLGGAALITLDLPVWGTVCAVSGVLFLTFWRNAPVGFIRLRRGRHP